MLSPKEIAEQTVNVGIKKAGLTWWRQLILGIVAGMFIALAGNASTVASIGAPTPGLARMLSGVLFGTGLIMVLLAGAELFTGNCLISMAVFEKKVKVISMLRNWVIVYIGNLIGGLIYSFLMSYTNQMDFDKAKLGANAINVAVGKCNLDFLGAFILGIFCNVLVCVAVWVSYSSKDVVGKIVAMFFPIWIFVASGYEHCVANMYFIPMGMFCKGNDTYVAAAMEQYGLTAEQIATVNWENFFVTNLIPVTLGNIVGGVVAVGAIYWFVYLKKTKEN